MTVPVVELSKPEVNFRCAFLMYLLDSSTENQNKLYQASVELANYATKLAMNESPQFNADKRGAKIILLVDSALHNIGFTQKEYDQLTLFLNTAVEKDWVLGRLGPSLVLGAAHSGIKIIEQQYYSLLQSIYTIELDGHRLTTNYPKPGNAALTLSKTLANITQNVIKNNCCSDTDRRAYIAAYQQAEGNDIEKHRGLKEKMHNFLIALSCVFVLPLIYQGYKAYQTGKFWAEPKTKTQEDVDISKKAIEILSGKSLNNS